MRRTKSPFTLLEILLVIALIGLTFGVLSIQFPKALREESFERGIDQVKAKIALAQELMLNYQTDVVVQFTPSEEGLLCSIKTQTPLSQSLENHVNRHAVIKGIDQVEFGENRETMLYFDGTLGATPKGKLLLKNKKREAILTLKGFPSLIQRGDHVVQETPATYPEKILSFI